MPLVFAIAALAVVLLVALLAVGRMGALPQARPDVAPLNLPEGRELSAADVTGVRFAVGLRGYRMDQVDGVLERLAVDVREKDARIALLQGQLGSEPGSSMEPAGDVGLGTAPARADPALSELAVSGPAVSEPTLWAPTASVPSTPDDEGGPVR
ncbi:MAG: DivIVA domain-containing protein [Candidatus Nanopelagicales bacterium]